MYFCGCSTPKKKQSRCRSIEGFFLFQHRTSTFACEMSTWELPVPGRVILSITFDGDVGVVLSMRLYLNQENKDMGLMQLELAHAWGLTDFLALSGPRNEWSSLRQRRVHSVWAPADQDSAHVGAAGVRIVLAYGGLLSLCLFVLLPSSGGSTIREEQSGAFFPLVMAG